MRKILIPLFIIVDFFVFSLYLGGSWYFSTVLLAAPVQDLAESRSFLTSELMPDWSAPAPAAVTISNGDIQLTGDYYDNPAEGQCAVIMLHGYTGTRYQALRFAPMFWERGCDILAYDARGHGGSSAAFHTYGYYEKDDAAAVIDWVVAETGLTPGEIGLVGTSYGAATALQTLFVRDDMAFILADSAYSDLMTIVRRQAVNQFGSWVQLFVPGATVVAQLRADMDVSAVSAADAVVEQDVPILLVHSRQDAFTPASHSETIYAAANQATTELMLTDWGAPHGQSLSYDYDAYVAAVDAFLAEQAPTFGLAP